MNFCLFLLFLLTSCSSYNEESHLKLVDQFQKQFESKIFDKYGLRTIATHGRLSNNIASLGIHFQHVGILSKDELRILLIEIANSYLEGINNDLSIRKFMNIYPFAAENIDITIFIVDPITNKIADPYIFVASVDKNISFYIRDSVSFPKIKQIDVETFEEASRIVQDASLFLKK